MKEPTFEHECEQTAYDALKARVPDIGQQSHWKAHSRWSQVVACENLIQNAEKIVPILNRLIAARRRAASGKTSVRGRPGNNSTR